MFFDDRVLSSFFSYSRQTRMYSPLAQLRFRQGESAPAQKAERTPELGGARFSPVEEVAPRKKKPRTEATVEAPAAAEGLREMSVAEAPEQAHGEADGVGAEKHSAYARIPEMKAVQEQIATLEREANQNMLNLRERIADIRAEFIKTVNGLDTNSSVLNDRDHSLIKRLDIKLDTLEKRAEIYEALYAHGEGHRALDAYQQKEKPEEMTPREVRRLARKQRRDEREGVTKLAELKKQLAELDEGRQDEEAAETVGSDEDDLTRSFAARGHVLRQKIRDRLSIEKGAEASDEEVDMFLGIRDAGGSAQEKNPLGFLGRLKHRGLSLMGRMFDRYQGSSLFDLADKLEAMEAGRAKIVQALAEQERAESGRERRKQEAYQTFHDPERRKKHEAEQSAIKARVARLKKTKAYSEAKLKRELTQAADEEHVASALRQQRARADNAEHAEETKAVLAKQTKREEEAAAEAKQEARQAAALHEVEELEESRVLAEAHKRSVEDSGEETDSNVLEAQTKKHADEIRHVHQQMMQSAAGSQDLFFEEHDALDERKLVRISAPGESDARPKRKTPVRRVIDAGAPSLKGLPEGTPKVAVTKRTKGELLSLRHEATTEGIMDAHELRLIESALLADTMDVFKSLPEKMLGSSNGAEMSLYIYQALGKSAAIKKLSELRDSWKTHDATGRSKIKEANDLLTSVMRTASRALEERLPRLERLAGRNAEKREKLSILKKIPEQMASLLLQSQEQRKTTVTNQAHKEYATLQQRVAEIEKLLRGRKLTNIEEAGEKKRLSDESAEAQLTMYHLNNLTRKVGIDLGAANADQAAAA